MLYHEAIPQPGPGYVSLCAPVLGVINLLLGPEGLAGTCLSLLYDPDWILLSLGGGGVVALGLWCLKIPEPSSDRILYIVKLLGHEA